MDQQKQPDTVKYRTINFVYFIYDIISSGKSQVVEISGLEIWKIRV